MSFGEFCAQSDLTLKLSRADVRKARGGKDRRRRDRRLQRNVRPRLARFTLPDEETTAEGVGGSGDSGQGQVSLDR
jgi:hypothetical protein